MARHGGKESPAEGDAPKTSARWGFALLGAAIAVYLVGGQAVPSRVRYVVFVGLFLVAFALLFRGRGGSWRARQPRQASGPGLAASDMVAVTVVRNQAEAEIIRGMLEANGVACRSVQSDFGAGSMDGMPGGSQRILVRESDVTRARDLLAEAR